MRKKLFLALVLFFVLFTLLSSLAKPTGLILDKHWLLTIDDNTEEIELPYYQYPDKPGLANFKTMFIMPEGDSLVIPSISCYAYEVRINNILVAEVGDIDNPTANIWNYAHIFSLDKSILKDKNELSINAYLLDDVGMHIPPFIEDKDKILGRISFFNFINTDMHYIMLGISITISLIMIAIFLYTKTDKRMYLYLGISTILGSLYSFDCQYRLYSGDIITFLYTRKLLFASLYLSGVFLILGIEKYTHKVLKIRKFVFLAIGIAIILVLFSEDFVTLRSWINVLNVIMIISPLSALILLVKHKNPRLFFSATFLTFILTYTVIAVLFKTNTPYLFQFGIMIFSIGLGATLIFEFTNMYHEKIKLYDKSLLDQLTNAYNRNILEEIKIENGDMLILTDLDNFKYYNDTFGHSVGDLLLKEVVNIMKGYLRKSDFIIRLGGDEFLIILKDANDEIAESIINRIRKELLKGIENKKVDISFGIIKYESDFLSSFNKADKLLYQMKLEKNEILKND